MNIALISAALPPQLDGIGDYTVHMATHLAQAACVSVLTCEGQAHTPIAGVKILPAFAPDAPASCARLLPLAQSLAPDWVILQYNPFAYGKWGRNLVLPRVMRQIKRGLPHTNLAVMVHEPFVPTINAKFAVMATWQRWQLWQLGRAADVLFFSMDVWAQRFRAWFPHTPVHHLPVGSNIPRVNIVREEARQRLNIAEDTVVLGLFGTAHVSRLLMRAQSASQAVQHSGRDVTVLYMGPHTAAVQSALGSMPLIAQGPLSAEEVSLRFAALDIYLAPFVDGVSTRRTSLMTALQHGVATVGTRGYNTDTLLKEQDGHAFVLADAQDADAFDRHVTTLAADRPRRESLGLAARTLYEQEFAWPTITRRMMAHLEDTSAKQSAGGKATAK